MMNLQRCIFVSIVLLLISVSASAQVTEGTWVGYLEGPDFLCAVRLDIPADGNDGKLTMLYGGDRRSGAIENLKATGVEVTFDAKLQPAARFRGNISGTSIKGTFDMLSRAGSVQAVGEWDVRIVDPKTIAEPTAAASPTSEDRIDLPDPAGKYRIGRRHFYWTDVSRNEDITDDPNDKRQVFVQLWYPAEKAERNPDAEYFPNVDKLRPDSPNLSAMKRTRTHAKMDAPMVRKKFPLVIFSPGLGGSSFTNTALVENFVSHGYVVAVIAHPYDTVGFDLPDGTHIRYDTKKWDREISKDWTAEDRAKFTDERRFGWAEDAIFVSEQLRRLDVAQYIDFEAMGFAGYSFGGQASGIVCATDPRFKACANLDGQSQGRALLKSRSNTLPKQPFLFFNKVPAVTDYELGLTGLTREQYRERDRRRLLKWNPSFKQQMTAVESGSYLIFYPGQNHASFSDFPLADLASGKPYSERVTVVKTVAEYTRAFFDKYLKKMPATLLDKPAPGSDLIVEFLKK